VTTSNDPNYGGTTLMPSIISGVNREIIDTIFSVDSEILISAATIALDAVRAGPSTPSS
jgi:hypothetical protein